MLPVWCHQSVTAVQFDLKWWCERHIFSQNIAFMFGGGTHKYGQLLYMVAERARAHVNVAVLFIYLYKFELEESATTPCVKL